MKIKVNNDNQIELTKVYNSICLKTDDNEIIHICMRDTGFEFKYNNNWYSIKNGEVKKL